MREEEEEAKKQQEEERDREEESSSEDGQRKDGAGGGGVYYWPAYEMVKEGFRDPYMDDGRHPKPEVVQEILSVFRRWYCADEEVDEEQKAGAKAHASVS